MIRSVISQMGPMMRYDLAPDYAIAIPPCGLGSCGRLAEALIRHVAVAQLTYIR
jgi:hypothetical protein